MAKRSSTILSPLRYPGSKRRLAKYIKQSLELNGLKPSLYIELFAGGASVALQLLTDELVDCAILVDRDPLISSFWRVVFNDTEWLIEQIKSIEVTVEKWREFKNSDPSSDRERALTCLFLNRTSFSGILAPQVGPIGGYEQKSKYPIDCRFPRDTLVRRLRQAATLRDRIYEVWTYSWEDAITEIRRKQSDGELPIEGLFFYLDPPFFYKANKLYRFYFEDNDHQNLRDTLLDLEDPWLLSYDSTEEVERLYGEAISNGTHKRKVELLYSTAETPGSKTATEVILSNLPNLPSGQRLWESSQGNKNAHKGSGNLEKEGSA